MRNLVAAVSSLVALTLVGPVVAQDPQVVKGPVPVATVGPTSQMADKVTLLEGPPDATSPAVREFTGGSGVKQTFERAGS